MILPLEEFIKETMLSIAKGVETSQNETPPDFNINPKIDRHGYPSGSFSTLIGKTHGEESILLIEFDVEVTATESDSGNGRVGVLFAGIGMRADAIREHSHQTAARIKFAIPIKYRSQN